MKRIISLFIPLFVGIISVKAQAPDSTQTQKIMEHDKIAEFPGGDLALSNYLNKNLLYPDSAKNNNIQGTIYISFWVEATGQLSDIRIKKGIHPLLDKEALRLIQGMPAWIPGSNKGIPIRMPFNFPLQFTLH